MISIIKNFYYNYALECKFEDMPFLQGIDYENCVLSIKLFIENHGSTYIQRILYE